METEEIKNKLYELGSVFTTSAAKKVGITSYTLNKLKCSEDIVEVGTGAAGSKMWSNQDFVFDRRVFIQKKYPDVVFSGQSALIWWGLIDRQPEFIDVTIPQGQNNKGLNQLKNVTVHHIGEKYYGIGLMEVDTPDYGAKLKVYDPERALIDVWRFENASSEWDRREAVYNYFQSDYKNSDKLFSYIKRFPGLMKLRALSEILNN